MFSRIRIPVSLLLAGLLIVAPAMGAPRALGMVLDGQHARVGKVVASSGVTVFAGDTLMTDVNGALRVRVGAAQIYLRENSRAKLDEVLGGVSAELERGIVGFASSGDESVNVLANGVQIRPRNSNPTHGQVLLVSPSELVVTSVSGEIEVLVDNDSHIVPSNSSYRVLLEQDPQAVEGAGAQAARRAKLVGNIVGWSIVGAAVAAVVIYNTRGNSGPVSPAVP